MKNSQSIIVIFVVNCALGVALDNGLARTPPMGWMSWGRFRCETDCENHPKTCINEELYREMANIMVEEGYLNAGYDYVHIDDCFTEKFRKNDKLMADAQRFPSDIPALAKYMHERGLKLGVYADYGWRTCENYPGSLGYLYEDANRIAEWNADYLKFDGCNARVQDMEQGYHTMQKFLNKTGRPIFYSCGWPLYFYVNKRKVNYKKAHDYCNSWRNYHDIEMSWESILDIIDFYNRNQFEFADFHGPGAWNDPDMIIAGNSEITEDQARVQMSIWAIWSAPLIMSNDLRNLPQAHKEILLNEKVIAIDQDPLGYMGRLVLKQYFGDVFVYLKKMTPISGGECSYAIAILNPTNSMKATILQLSQFEMQNKEGYIVEDVWKNEIIGLFHNSSQIYVQVKATGVVLLKATISQTLFK